MVSIFGIPIVAMGKYSVLGYLHPLRKGMSTVKHHLPQSNVLVQLKPLKARAHVP